MMRVPPNIPKPLFNQSPNIFQLHSISHMFQVHSTSKFFNSNQPSNIPTSNSNQSLNIPTGSHNQPSNILTPNFNQPLNIRTRLRSTSKHFSASINLQKPIRAIAYLRSFGCSSFSWEFNFYSYCFNIFLE
jgi:hypothetical protein